jgi:AcrR family transcriptional regulator
MGSEGRRKILDSVADLLGRSDASSVTTRAIADNAGVNPAMVNYYFGSKDALMTEAVRSLFETPAHERGIAYGNPRKAMFDILEDMCRRIIDNSRYGSLYIPDSLLKDRMTVPPALANHLKDHFKGGADGSDHMIAAYQLTSFLKLAAYRPEAFLEFSGIDMRIRSERERLISRQLDIFLGERL